jgi:hypothetical protein
MKKLFISKIFTGIVLFLFFPFSAIAQWVQTAGPSGGVTEDLKVSGSFLVAGTYGGGTFRTQDNGSTWIKVTDGLLNTNVNALAVSDTILFAGTFGGVYRSVNNGTSWSPTGLWYNNLVQAMAVSGKTLIAGSRNGPYLSTDTGASWTAITTGLSNLSITAVAISDTNLFAGTETGLYRAPRNGARWTAINSGLANTNISKLFLNGSYLLAGTSNGVFLSSNSGTSWSQLYSGLPAGSVESFAAVGQTLFSAVRGGGVYRLDTNAKTWVNTNMPEPNVFSLAIQGNFLFAGTGTYVWRRPLTELITSIDSHFSEEKPLALKIYPNPFSSNGKIEFRIRSACHVDLKVYDLKGQELINLVSEFMVAGSHSVNFNNPGLPAGIYVCKIKADEVIQNCKFTIK